MARNGVYPTWDVVLLREIRRRLSVPVAETIVDIVEGCRLDDQRAPGIGTGRARMAIERLSGYLREELR